MTATRDDYLLTLRNQAEARGRGVEAPRMTLSPADLVVALDEIAADRTALDASSLIFQWLAADDTRSIAIDETGEDPRLALKVATVDTHFLALDTDGRATITSGQRTTLESEL